MGALTGKLGTFGTVAAGIGVAGAIAAVSVVKMAGDFESSTNRLVTSAGESQANIGKVRDGILGMAGAVGYTAEQLSAAMYKVESGGQHGADGLMVLKAAAQGAKAEGADLTVVSDALTSAMTDYHEPASRAADVTSKLVAATSQGKMTFEQLAGSLNSILPVASANHISLNEILGDLASMTVHGISAQQASQNLAYAIRSMSAPSAAARKELAVLGINATELSANLGKKGLSATLEEVSQAIKKGMGPESTMTVVNLDNALKGLPPSVKKLGEEFLTGNITAKQFHGEMKNMDPIAVSQAKSFAALVSQMHGIGTEAKSASEVYQSYTQALSKATGGATGLNVALMLTGENAQGTTDKIKVISGATADAAGNVHGWDEIQGTFNQKMAEAKAGLNAMAISIGTYLLPVASKIAGVFADASKFLTEHKTIAEVVAYTLGIVVVGALTALTVTTVKWAVTSAYSMVEDTVKGAIWLGAKIASYAAAAASAVVSAAVAAGAWIAANIAMIAATGGIILAVAAVIAIGYLIVKNWGAIKEAASAVWGWIKEWVGKIAGEIVDIFLHWTLLGIIINHWNDIITFITKVPGEILRIFGGAENWLVNAGKNIVIGLWNGIVGVAGWLWDQIRGWLDGLWKGVLGFFHISSPSGLAAEAGAAIAAGLAGGIDTHGPLAVSAALSMSSKVGGALSAGINPGAALGLAGGTGLGPRGASGAGAAPPPEIRLTIDSAGSRMDDLILESLQRAVQIRGGDVQQVVGRAA